MLAAFAGLVTALLLPSLALASSYWSTLNYSVALNGSVRTYDGVSMKIDFTSQASFDHVLNKWQTISLYRQSCVLFICNDAFIGSVNVTRIGWTGTQIWTNVGPGSYWFRFSKANDGVVITSNDVHMYN